MCLCCHFRDKRARRAEKQKGKAKKEEQEPTTPSSPGHEQPAEDDGFVEAPCVQVSHFVTSTHMHTHTHTHIHLNIYQHTHINNRMGDVKMKTGVLTPVKQLLKPVQRISVAWSLLSPCTMIWRRPLLSGWICSTNLLRCVLQLSRISTIYALCNTQ